MKRLFDFDVHIGDWRVMIQGRDIEKGAIRPVHIAPEAITGDHIVTNSITGEKIMNHSVIGRNIAPGSIDASKIAPGTLDGTNFNLIAIEIEEDGTLVAIYGMPDDHVTVEMDDQGVLYIVYPLAS